MARVGAALLLLSIGFTCAEIQDVDNSTCLPDGIPYASRQLLLQNGLEIPLGFWVQDWPSARLSTEVAKIFVREVLGVHAITSGLGGLSTYGLYASAGCREPTLFVDERRACSIESHAETKHHVSLEVWGLAKLVEMERVLGAMPSIIPENAGSMGYVGFQGLYVFQDEKVAAYEAGGLALDYYRSWNMSWNEPWHFFDKMSDVDDSLLVPCEENPQLQDAAVMSNYLFWTGDEDGIVRDDNGNVIKGQCWNNSWWVPPACRENISRCVPSITAGGAWGFPQSMQQTFAHNMPIAIAVAVDSQTWGKLGRSIRGAHYWYTPDTTFIKEVPQRIVLPEYSKDEARKGKLDADDAASPLSKFVWSGMADVAPVVHSFLYSYEIKKEDMDSMLFDAESNPQYTDEEVACRWMRAYEARWMSWVPDPRHCKPGSGIVDEAGNFVDSIENATRCEFCPAGWHGSSKNSDNTRVCVECPVGTSQALPGQTACVSCSSGHFAGQPGQPHCQVCGEGHFQNATGASDCRRCPGGSTTRLLGAVSSDECICPRHTYQPFLGDGRSGEEMECRPCPAGMSCDIDSRERWLIMDANLSMASRAATGNYPTVMEGYMTLESQPLRVFKCITEGACPGGRPGTCSSKRDGTTVACGECQMDAYEDVSGQCQTCNKPRVVALLLLAFTAVFVALVFLSWASNRERITEVNAGATCAIIAGLTCSSIQTMSVLSNLEVEWHEPLKSVLSVMLLFGFDLRMINLGCLIDGGVGMFVLRQLLAPVFAGTLFIIALVQRKFMPTISLGVHVSNSVGSLFLLFYTAMVLSAVMPLACYKHPSSSGESMVSDPAILCFDGQKHSTMMAAGLVGLGVICIPFFAFVLLATALYPRIVAAGSTMHLRRALFLFRRFKPSAFYYSAVLLSRSLFLCMVPVVLRDKVGAQLLVVSITLSAFVFVQSSVRPWRGGLANVLDTSISLTLNLVIMCGAVSTAAPDAKESVSVVGHLAIIFMFFAAVLFLAVSLYVRLVPRPFYAFFVSHHKAVAAAQARLLQQMLQRKSKQQCFLDSDHLTNLDELFDVVRSRVGRMIIYLTRDVLQRPWCVGEITTAYKAKVSATRVLTPSFAASDIRRRRAPGDLGEAMGPEFLEAGVYQHHVQAALQWLLSPKVHEIVLNEGLLGLGITKFNALADRIALESGKKNSSRGMATAAPQASGLSPGSILLSCHIDDEEAIACAGIMALLLQDWAISQTGHGVCSLCDLSLLDFDDVNGFQGIKSVMISGTATIMLLTEGSLTSTLQLNTMFAAVELIKSGLHGGMVSVSTEKFRFPDETYYTLMLPQVLDSDLSHDDATNMLQQLFRMISVHLTPHASCLILVKEAEQVKKRLVLDRRRQGLNGIFSSSLPLRSGSPRGGSPRGSSPLSSWTPGGVWSGNLKKVNIADSPTWTAQVSNSSHIDVAVDTNGIDVILKMKWMDEV